MPNRLCAACMNTCKQEPTAKIVRCPSFRKRLSDEEFRDLMHELDVMEASAAYLSRRVKDLIAKVLSENAAAQPSSIGGPDISTADRPNGEDGDPARRG
jgi:hypothetical protein